MQPKKPVPPGRLALLAMICIVVCAAGAYLLNALLA
jgi:hypothetical protein